MNLSCALRKVGDLLAERDIDECHETVCLWWNQLDPRFIAESRRRWVETMRALARRQRPLDEDYLKIYGERARIKHLGQCVAARPASETAWTCRQ